MTRRPLLTALLVALPAVLVAVAGTTHPEFLTPDTADRWLVAHLVLLPLFPLVGLALVWLLRGDRSPLAWGARVLAYGWAVLYTALDAIAGVGLSWQVRAAAERGAPGPDLGDAFFIGDRVGRPGALLLGGAGLLLALACLRRGPLAVVGGVVVAVSSVVVYERHVFPPEGVLGMVGVGVGLALVALSGAGSRAAGQPSTSASPTATSGSVSGAASSTVSTGPSGP